MPLKFPKIAFSPKRDTLSQERYKIPVLEYQVCLEKKIIVTLNAKKEVGKMIKILAVGFGFSRINLTVNQQKYITINETKFQWPD